ncbi:MAG: hypothetical protein A2494_00730 [Candidatus Lloydbacteria bacterium RIFOXYC12_FULL_46_25]|uniref:Uncharacterized protein n=1 Tax=Candidatus Lloydbacteria bacterium RIFOXYC12_FULL_46_25 TaxID=1798670 RepID=A0A1G2DV15_9BACT|nr:MAG: hypothetical protein A2494_00730 [Candidatus Lloydbacteria bacterium RIFOXYC12_FULL_46_25]
MLYNKTFSVVTAFFLLPSFAHAQVSDIFGFTVLIYSLIQKVGFLFWVLAIALFFWGLVKFIANAGDTAEHEKGKKFIVWGLISFVVLVSIWGIVRIILVDTLGISPASTQYLNKNNTVIAP